MGYGTFVLMPKSSTDNRRVVEVAGISKENNAQVQLWEYADVPQQKWYFELMPSSSGNYKLVTS